jgi:type IV pilus assembly protein PilV
MPKSANKAHSGGFSLIEVLIAMLILAFGVLSMGGLQLAALKSNQMAGNMSAAAAMAKDYTEMMRSNPSVSSVTSTVAGVNPYFFDTNNFSTSSPNCLSAVCGTTTMATLHVADWAQRVKNQLPGGRAVVCRDPSPRIADGSYRWACGTNDATSVTIKIGWIDKRDREERGTTALSATPLNPQLVMAGFTGYAE